MGFSMDTFSEVFKAIASVFHTITVGCDIFWHKKSAIPNTMVSGFYYLHFDKLFMPDATQSPAPYSLLLSLIFQTH